MTCPNCERLERELKDRDAINNHLKGELIFSERQCHEREKEVERLERERDEWKKNYEEARTARWEFLEREITHWKAEAERMREALEVIAEAEEAWQETARAALGEGKP